MTDASTLGWWGVPLAIAGGAIRVGTPLLWVSLGETVTETESVRTNDSVREIVGFAVTVCVSACSLVTARPIVGLTVTESEIARGNDFRAEIVGLTVTA